jgi:hypothetical protein
VSQPPQNANRALGDVTVGIFLFALPLYLLNLASVRATKIFNADLGTPFMIAQDVLRDPRNIFHWNFPEAPYFFPDTIQAIILMAVFRDYHTAILVDVGIKVLMFVGITYWLCCLVGVREKFLAVAAVTVLIHLVVAAFHPVPYEMMMTAQFRSYIHSGAFLSTGLAWCLALMTISKPALLPSLSLSALTFISSASDLLYIVHWFVPFSFCFLGLAFLNNAIRIEALKIVGLNAVSVILSIVASALLGLKPPSADLTIAGSSAAFITLRFWIEQFFSEAPILVIIAATTASYFFLNLINRRFWTDFSNRGALSILTLGMTLSVLVGIFVLVASGRFSGSQSWKYFLTAHWFIVVAVIFLIPNAVARIFSLRIAGASISLAAISSLPNTIKAHRYEDPVVNCVREITEDRRIDFAIGDYWSAKVVSAALDGQIGMIPITLSGKTSEWAYSLERVERARIHEHPNGQRLILLNWLDRTAIQKNFGQITDTLTCQGFRFATTGTPSKGGHLPIHRTSTSHE